MINNESFTEQEHDDLAAARSRDSTPYGREMTAVVPNASALGSTGQLGRKKSLS